MSISNKFWRMIAQRKINKRKRVVMSYDGDLIDAVYDFCTTAQTLRTPENCARALKSGGYWPLHCSVLM